MSLFSIPRTAGLSRQVRLLVAAVLAVLLAASTAWLVMAVRSDDGAEASDEREAAILAARSYVQAASNFGPQDLDEQNTLTAYRDRVRPLISTSYRETFEEGVDNVTPLAVEGFGTSTTVDRAGVVSINDDRATVLIGGETARSIKDKTEQAVGYTLQISLVKNDGSWLVDRTPCQVAQDLACEATDQPQAPPTDAPDEPTKKGSDGDKGGQGSDGDKGNKKKSKQGGE